MPIFNVVERLTPASCALLLYPQKGCALYNDLVHRTVKFSMDSFSRKYNIFTNVVKWYMCFSITAWLVWSGQRANALRTALLTKGYAILVRWWPGILACRNISNSHSLRFPPLPKSCDSPFLLLQCYQLFRWVFSSNRLWDGRLLWCRRCSLLLWPCNLRFCPCRHWTLPLHVKTSTFTNTNWQNGLNTITIATSFFLWRFFPLFLVWATFGTMSL